jgi:ParB-like chromosome segregation protein Spo0J
MSASGRRDRVKLVIKYLALDDIAADPRNARKHPPAQIRKIERLIAEYGWTTPMGIADGQLIYGHARRTAARNLRDRGVAIPGNPDPDKGPTVDLSHLSAVQRRAYALADNRASLDAGFDADVLADELADLDADGFDLDLTGFEADEIDGLVTGGVAGGKSAIREIAVAAVEDRFWVSVRGPLALQAQALQRLRTVMAELPGLDVELGTVMDGE